MRKKSLAILLMFILHSLNATALEEPWVPNKNLKKESGSEDSLTKSPTTTRSSIENTAIKAQIVEHALDSQKHQSEISKVKKRSSEFQNVPIQQVAENSPSVSDIKVPLRMVFGYNDKLIRKLFDNHYLSKDAQNLARYHSISSNMPPLNRREARNRQSPWRDHSVMHFGKRKDNSVLSDNNNIEQDDLLQSSENINDETENEQHFKQNDNLSNIFPENIENFEKNELDEPGIDEVWLHDETENLQKKSPDSWNSHSVMHFGKRSSDPWPDHTVMHFGKRSTDSWPSHSVMHFGKKSADSWNAHSVMHFGKRTEDPWNSHSVMHFGKKSEFSPTHSVMHFGKRGEDPWNAHSVMHFGKRGEYPWNSHSVMHFGKRGEGSWNPHSVMHFGKRGEEPWNAHSVMHFGKKSDDSWNSHSVMHFGKREEEPWNSHSVMHFGKRGEEPWNSHSVMHFGKRGEEPWNSHSVMHFGKKREDPWNSHSVMHFGKKEDPWNSHSVMHFGKRLEDSIEDYLIPEQTDKESSANDLEIEETNKRETWSPHSVMHFGKKSLDEDKYNQYTEADKKSDNWEDSSFLHFGKRFPDSDPNHNVMHFGKRSIDTLSVQSKQLTKRSIQNSEMSNPESNEKFSKDDLKKQYDKSLSHHMVMHLNKRTLLPQITNNANGEAANDDKDLTGNEKLADLDYHNRENNFNSKHISPLHLNYKNAILKEDKENETENSINKTPSIKYNKYSKNKKSYTLENSDKTAEQKQNIVDEDKSRHLQKREADDEWFKHSLVHFGKKSEETDEMKRTDPFSSHSVMHFGKRPSDYRPEHSVMHFGKRYDYAGPSHSVMHFGKKSDTQGPDHFVMHFGKKSDIQEPDHFVMHFGKRGETWPSHSVMHFGKKSDSFAPDHLVMHFGKREPDAFHSVMHFGKREPDAFHSVMHFGKRSGDPWSSHSVMHFGKKSDEEVNSLEMLQDDSIQNDESLETAPDTINQSDNENSSSDTEETMKQKDTSNNLQHENSEASDLQKNTDADKTTDTLSSQYSRQKRQIDYNLNVKRYWGIPFQGPKSMIYPHAWLANQIRRSNIPVEFIHGQIPMIEARMAEKKEMPMNSIMHFG